MLSKESFIEAINAFISHGEKEQELCKSLETLIDGHFVLNFSREIQESFLKILEREMNDLSQDVIGSTISWWLYDAPNCGKSESAYIGRPNGEKIYLKTAEQLYDYLITCT